MLQDFVCYFDSVRELGIPLYFDSERIGDNFQLMFTLINYGGCAIGCC